MLTFSALSDPTRRTIVEMLAYYGELTVREIGSQFTMSAPAISQHLKILREAQLVQCRVQKQQRVYAINELGLAEMEQWVQNLQRFRAKNLEALEASLTSLYLADS